MDAVNKFASDEIIAIALDDEDTEFKIQKAILCEASTYFNAALSRGFKEASERKLRLPGCDSDVLRVTLYWHCRNDFPKLASEVEETSSPEERQSLADERCILLIKVWVFGDAYLMPKLSEGAMHELTTIFKGNKVTCNVIRQGYVLAPKQSCVRDFFVKAARHEHFYGKLSVDQLKILAQTPGFISDFMTPVKTYVAKTDFPEHEWDAALKRYTFAGT